MPVILFFPNRKSVDLWVNSAVYKAMLSSGFYSIDNMYLTAEFIHGLFSY